MTTPTPPPDPRHGHVPDDVADELVSAVLDGEADQAARGRVDADGALRARQARLQAASAAVAALDEPTAAALAGELAPARREAAIAAALAAWDSAPADPSDLAAARARRAGRTPWVRRLPAFAAAAAALAVVALVAGGAVGSGGGDEQATTGGRTADLESTAEDGAGGGGAIADEDLEGRERRDDGPASESMPGADQALSAPATVFADEEALVTHVRGQLAAPAATANAAGAGCPGAPGDDVVYEETVLLRGRPLLARVHRGDEVVLLIDPNDCSVLETLSL